jgi:hypothetical protein
VDMKPSAFGLDQSAKGVSLDRYLRRVVSDVRWDGYAVNLCIFKRLGQLESGSGTPFRLL